LEDRRLGACDQWIRHVREVRDKHQQELSLLENAAGFRRLCELNVIEQVRNVGQTDIVRDAWFRNQSISIHGWIYAIENGLLSDLCVSLAGPESSRKYAAP
jgi:carbonic anhydrase